ncbi:MAG TPA: ATP-binding protein [Chroococcales cyanobacterium]
MGNQTLLPVMHHGIALLNLDGKLERQNEFLLDSLGEPGEKNSGEKEKRLRTLLEDPAFHELVEQAKKAGFAEMELLPSWWEGQHLSMSIARCGDTLTLTVMNITPIHHLASMEQDFVANVSHELRTPLTSIRMAAESLQIGAMGSEHMRAKFLSNIQREADRLTRLVNELLVVANLHGRPVMHKNIFTFPELAGEVIATLQPHADLNSVDLRLECADDLPAYNGDRDRLHQVLINLVDNAIKFTPASGRVTLALAHLPAEDKIQVKVIDSGIGVPEIDRPRIFDRFYRVDKSRSRVTGGVGLGLSIVKDIIEAHGGSIRVESEINKGTTFFIDLPLHPHEENPQ